jgi:hypothetical protein
MGHVSDAADEQLKSRVGAAHRALSAERNRRQGFAPIPYVRTLDLRGLAVLDAVATADRAGAQTTGSGPWLCVHSKHLERRRDEVRRPGGGRLARGSDDAQCVRIPGPGGWRRQSVSDVELRNPSISR